MVLQQNLISRVFVICMSTIRGRLQLSLRESGDALPNACSHYITCSVCHYRSVTILPVPSRSMAILSSLFVAVVALSGAVFSTPVKQVSKILFDGRLPWKTSLSDLDSYSTSPYNAEYVLGTGTKMSCSQ